jgi:mannosyltransferase OCH1-like enzyme
MFPKKIHLTCKNKEFLENNSTYKLCLSEYHKIYPNYSIHVYDDDDIYELIKENFPDDYDFITTIKGVMLADTFRYLILYLEGGIYSDFDCIPVKNIELLFNHSYFHGDSRRNNNFFIYPKDKPLLNTLWDYYENQCNHHSSQIKENGDFKVYECLGHKCITDKTNIVIGKENIYLPNETSQAYNASRLCQWFMMSKPKQQIFLEFYKGCISNLKEKYKLIVKMEEEEIPDKYKHFNNVIFTTGPGFFTNIINKYLPNEEISILPADFFCCGSGTNASNFIKFSDNSYVRHLFCGSWRLPS